VPFAALSDEDSDEPTVSADQFHPGNDLNGLHGWISTPHTWEVRPEDQALRAELRVQIQASLEQLPPTQRTVISLRDIEGWSAQEVCNILAISESNQRVLLHRARAGVRRALDAYLQPN
jgi:RNA polymerase sigma-70 factor (ECF subfamily)